MKVKRVIFTDTFSPMENMPIKEADPTNPGGGVDRRLAVMLTPLATLNELWKMLDEFVEADATEFVAYTNQEMNFVLMREASRRTSLAHATGGDFRLATSWRLDSQSVAVLFDLGRRVLGEKGSVPVVKALTLIQSAV